MKEKYKNLKSPKNKTIDFDFSKGKEYFKNCLSYGDDFNLFNIQNKTINGDTFDIMPKLPKSFVDLAIIDPPYNLTKNYNGNKFNSTNNEKYYGFTEKWLLQLLPLLKPNASIYVCCDWKSSPVIWQVLEKYLKIQNRITWQREKGRGAKENWKNGLEDIWFATNSNNYYFNLDAVKIRKKVIAPYRENGKAKDWEETDNGNYRNTCPSNFWNDISIPYWSMPENTAHPTQKPEKLIAKLILASSKVGDIIFDPFLGSGTTSVVAKKLERRYVGIEKDKIYCSWAEYRLSQTTEKDSIQGYTDGVFWERNTLVEQKRFMPSNKEGENDDAQISLFS